MIKLVIGFVSVIFFITMIILAVYYLKQYRDDKKRDITKYDPYAGKRNNLFQGSIAGDIDSCIGFLKSLISMNAEIPNLDILLNNIIHPLDKIIQIIEKYPEKSDKIQEELDYIIPLIKKLSDEYCFHKQQSESSVNSAMAMRTCEKGLAGISEIIYKKADSMLEDRYFDIHSEVSAFLQLHSLHQSGIKP